MNNDEMIVCRNICLNFGEKIIFNNLDFEFHKNKTYVISGKNGIGKTTLLNIFAGYIQYRGEIIKNQTLSLDYLLQDNTLFSNMTVKNNLLLKYLIYSNNLDSFKDVCNNALNQFHILNLLDRKVNCYQVENTKKYV